MATIDKQFWIHRGMAHAKGRGICNVRVKNVGGTEWASDALGPIYQTPNTSKKHLQHKVLAWRLSNTMDAIFCKESLDEAIAYGPPRIMNTGQGSQFTGAAWITFYNTDRPHTALDKRTPDEAYLDGREMMKAA